MTADADVPGRSRFGHYTGIVHANADPEKAGRLQVIVPAVMGQEVLANWALMGGQHFGTPPSTRGRRGRGRGTFRVPPVGSQVVVVFLDGDVQAPMWLPGVWPRDQVPEQVRAGYPSKSVLARGENFDVVEDGDGDIDLRAGSRNLDITLDTRGGDVSVRTDGAGGGVIKLQGGGPTQMAIRATDGIVCGTLGIVVASGVIVGITYTLPTGGPPITLAPGGTLTTPLIGLHQGGAPKVLIGD